LERRGRAATPGLVLPVLAPLLQLRAVRFHVTAATERHTLSLHDALPIYPAAQSAGEALPRRHRLARPAALRRLQWRRPGGFRPEDRKSTRLNSSHVKISYAVFSVQKKKDQPGRPTVAAAATRSVPLRRLP